nr:hypothetical protein CFP56_03701 [Quercus suber]
MSYEADVKAISQVKARAFGGHGPKAIKNLLMSGDNNAKLGSNTVERQQPYSTLSTVPSATSTLSNPRLVMYLRGMLSDRRIAQVSWTH